MSDDIGRRADGSTDSVARAGAFLSRYAAMGGKRSGGAGDLATGEWIESDLIGHGFAVERQALAVPWTEDRNARLTIGERSAPVQSHPGSPGGNVSGALARWTDGAEMGDVAGAIVVIDLPTTRWSSARDPRISARVEAAFAAGATAAVLVTHGPTGTAIALNTEGLGYDYDRPIAIISPSDAGWLSDVRGRAAVLDVSRDEGTRQAFNVIGTLDRGAARTVVLSTPRSGWSECAGERGSGLAAWLLLVEWASRTLGDFNLIAFCATGHELGYSGAARFLEAEPPSPGQVALWLHIGANAATRDYREVRGLPLALPSADTQRFLAVSAAHLHDAEACFAGAPALEAPHDVAMGAAGELAHIHAAGYALIAGVFGAHRFHHTMMDDIGCTSAELSADLACRMRNFISAVLG